MTTNELIFYSIVVICVAAFFIALMCFASKNGTSGGTISRHISTPRRYDLPMWHEETRWYIPKDKPKEHTCATDQECVPAKKPKNK